MKEFLTSMGVLGMLLLVFLMFCLVPMLFLWSINTLSEIGGSDFYIPHTIWSYVASFVLVAMFNSSASSD